MAHKSKEVIVLVVCVLVHATFEIDYSNKRSTKYLIENVFYISSKRGKKR